MFRRSLELPLQAKRSLLDLSNSSPVGGGKEVLSVVSRDEPSEFRTAFNENSESNLM